jgi:hypothetical protein
MKHIKGLLFVFVGLFIFVTLISLLIPSKIVVAKGVNIKADSTKVFALISDLNNWKSWHPVFKSDSLKIAVTTNQTTKLSKATWQTKGKQNVLVLTNVTYPLVYFNLQREGERAVENLISLQSDSAQAGMQVQWQSITSLRWYPWEKFGGIFIEKLSGSGYETALASLKEFAEKN